MIKNSWYPIVESSELKDKPIGILRLGLRLILWRNKTEIICLFDQCAHRGAALSIGKIINGEIQCPFHGLQFNNKGKCTYIPSRGRNYEVPEYYKVNSYLAREKHDFIWIWYGDKKENDSDYPEIPWFEDIDDKFTYKTKRDLWKTHYSRCIENQLDVAHLFLVHRTTIGRGDRRVCDGPIVKYIDNTELIWVFNRKEDGKVSLLPKEIPENNKRPFLHFKFPNIWQNKLDERVRIFIAFVPIDNENTMIYMRFYQKFLRIPILKGIINQLGLKFSTIVLHQDRSVVETQVPKVTDVKIGENLFPADAPIIMYRKMRNELKNRSKEL